MKKIINVQKDTIIQIICSLQLIFFVHTVISTYVNIESFKNLMPFYTAYKLEVAWATIFAEVAIICLLFFPATRFLGLISTTVISIFAGYLVIKYPRSPHDFGGILNYLSDSQQLLLYTLTMTMSMIALCLLLVKQKSKKQEISETIVFT